MEEAELVPDDRHELQYDEQSCGEDRVEMELDADLVRILEVVVALSWCSAGCTGAVGVAEYAAE